jgi:hypothetical protein
LRSENEAIEIIDTAFRHPVLQELKIAHHAGQKIVEVMSKTAGQLSNRLHLLSLAKCFFDPLLIGLVAADNVKEIRFCVGNGGPHDRARGAIAGQHMIDEAGHYLALGKPGDNVRCFGVIGRIDDLDKRAGQQFVFGPAEQLCPCRVDLNEVAIEPSRCH